MIVCASNSLSSLTNLNAHPAAHPAHQSGTRTLVRRPSQITKEKVGVQTRMELLDSHSLEKISYTTLLSRVTTCIQYHYL